MASKNKVTMEEDTLNNVQSSVASLYSGLIEKRKQEQYEREERKRIAREEREKAKEAEAIKEDGTKKSKKERQEEKLDAWKEIIVGLTGDDLEYVSPKKSKKKYKKWISDDDGPSVLTEKPKKQKKRNYNKEFEPELNMLKSIVADQNKFTADLQKRFNIAAGPATRDAQMPNKTLVELAAAINSGRSNSLSVLKEIGNVKKTIADLYMKQKKLDADLGGGGSAASIGTGDLGLMGSNIAASLFGDNQFTPVPSAYSVPVQEPSAPSTPAPEAPTPVAAPVPNNVTPLPVQQQPVPISNFDPDSWEGPELASYSMAPFENIPHEVIVEKNGHTGESRFKAINTSTGAEIPNYPLPAQDLTRLKFNEKDGFVKGEFDERYRLEVI